MTGDEPQGTMGDGKVTDSRRPLSPSRLPLRARFKERRLGTRQGKNASAFVCVAALLLLNVKIYVLFYALLLASVNSSSRCKEDKNLW